MVTKLSSKGQIVLPQGVREAHRWTPGTEFTVEDTPAGVLLRPVKPFPATAVDEVFGCAGYTGPRRTLADMQGAITAEAARHKP